MNNLFLYYVININLFSTFFFKLNLKLPFYIIFEMLKIIMSLFINLLRIQVVCVSNQVFFMHAVHILQNFIIK